jgi:Fibronectin type III domain
MSEDTNSPIPDWPPEPQQPPQGIPPQPGTPSVPPQQSAWQQPEQDAWQVPPTQSLTPQQGFPWQGFPQQAAPQQEFPQQGGPQQGFPQQGFPQQGGPQQGFPQPGFPLPSVPPPAAPGKRRRPPLWALIAGGLALVGLVAGLLVWAPWSPAPQAPAAVRVSSPTATTALVSWTAPTGGATPSQYNILRDGKEQGIVPGSQTSWTDTGLTPGSRHSYTVVTVGNGQSSGPSAATSVTTVTPAPAGVTATGKTYTTVTLHWSPPANAPAPAVYTIYDTSAGKAVLDSVNGSTTTYTVTQLVPGDKYTFGVTASWGLAQSAMTAISAPPLSVPLNGSVPVNLKVTQILAGSTGLAVGDTWTDYWNFTASCQAASCTLTDKGSLQGTVAQFTAKLTPANGGFEGQASHVQFAHCGSAPSYETFIVRMYPDSGGVSNGAWTSWHGTLTLAATTQYVGSDYCAGGNWVMALTGTGSSST